MLRITQFGEKISQLKIALSTSDPPNHLLVEPWYYHSDGSKIALLPWPWQYHGGGSKKSSIAQKA